MIDMDDDLIRKARNCLWLRRVTWAVIAGLLAVGVHQCIKSWSLT